MIRHAIILVGGLGSRLRPLTDAMPKPLLPVAHRPFLESQLKRLAQAGVKRVVLSTHYQSAVVARSLKKLRHFGLSLELRREPKPLGTGGAIRFAWPELGQPSLALNGDVLSDFDIRPMVKQHLHQMPQATLWTVNVKDTAAFGVIEIGRDGRISRFVEKPKPGQAKGKAINAGLYVLQPGFVDWVPAGRAVSIEREIFPRMLAGGADLRAYAAPKGTYWNDIGTPEAYRLANLAAVRGQVKIKGLWPKQGLRHGALLAKGVKIGPGCDIEGSVLLEDCQLGARVKARRCVMASGCKLEDGVVLEEGTVLGPNTRIHCAPQA